MTYIIFYFICISGDALMIASSSGHNASVELLLTHGADINAKDKYGRTALMYASKHGHTAIVELLLNHGADINDKDNKGSTALMFASEHGHTATVDLLLTHGADINAEDNNDIIKIYETNAAEQINQSKQNKEKIKFNKNKIK